MSNYPPGVTGSEPEIAGYDDEDDVTYKILRFYKDNDEMNREVIAEGLTLAEAKAHCNDPETSSSTATSTMAIEHTAKHGAWFDGYEEE